MKNATTKADALRVIGRVENAALDLICQEAKGTYIEQHTLISSNTRERRRSVIVSRMVLRCGGGDEEPRPLLGDALVQLVEAL